MGAADNQRQLGLVRVGAEHLSEGEFPARQKAAENQITNRSAWSAGCGRGFMSTHKSSHQFRSKMLSASSSFDSVSEPLSSLPEGFNPLPVCGCGWGECSPGGQPCRCPSPSGLISRPLSLLGHSGSNACISGANLELDDDVTKLAHFASWANYVHEHTCCVTALKFLTIFIFAHDAGLEQISPFFAHILSLQAQRG